MTPIPPRPTLIDAQVKLGYPPLAKWFVANGGNGQVARAAFEGALRELFATAPADSYKLAKVCDDHLKWTAANAELVAIFADVLEAAPKAHVDMEAEWVMTHGVRVSQRPRDSVLFYVGDDLCHGVVQNVLGPRAQLIVALIDRLDARSRNTPIFCLNVEDIIERAVLTQVNPLPDSPEEVKLHVAV